MAFNAALCAASDRDQYCANTGTLTVTAWHTFPDPPSAGPCANAIADCDESNHTECVIVLHVRSPKCFIAYTIQEGSAVPSFVRHVQDELQSCSLHGALGCIVILNGHGQKTTLCVTFTLQEPWL